LAIEGASTKPPPGTHQPQLLREKYATAADFDEITGNPAVSASLAPGFAYCTFL
jgi:hypothetical protein